MSSRTARAAVWVGSVRETPPRRTWRFLAPALVGLLSVVGAYPTLAQGTFSVDDVSTNEGAAGTTIFTFNVSRTDTTAAADITVETQDGTATTGDNDYVAVAPQTVSFAIGVGSMPVQVSVNGDGKVELTEMFNVVLSNPTVGTILDGTGVGAITNDDAATLARLGGFQVTEGNAPATPTATFTVTLSAPVDVDVTVDIATEDLVATVADGDYQLTTGTVTFLAGSTTNQTFPVLVNGDAKVEFNQRFQTRISNVQAQGRAVTIFDALQTTNIVNDDQGRFIINDVTMAEGTGPGTTAFTFDVVLLDAAEVPAGQTLSVDASTANGTATTADNDYVAAGPTTRSFIGTANEVQTFVVQVNLDAKVELDETFQVNLSNLVVPTCNISNCATPPLPAPLNVIILDSQAIGSIPNDDVATLAIGDRVALETNTGSTPTFSFTATLSAQVDVPVNVDFATANGTATTADSDYASASGTLNFAGTAGETKTVLVTVNGDDKVELDEVFSVNLSNIQASSRNVTFADSQGLGTIVNDETATLSITDVTLVEGAAGTTPFNFTVSLNRQLANPFSVDVDAVADTATSADNDFAPATPPTLNFAGNQNESVQVQVNVNGDSNAELNEVFRVVLSNVQAAGLEADINIADQGLGTINNDDVMDLAITKDDGGVNSFPSGPIAYTLSYQNLGGKTARGVTITDTVPTNTTLDSAGSDPGWVCAPDNSAGSTCTLDVGTVLAAGSGSAIFALTVDDLASLPPIPTTITNTASISDETAGFADTSASNNTDTDTTLVVEFAPTSFFALSPCRVIDTRNSPGPLGGPALNANADRTFPVAPHAACGIPATAKAISVTFAAVNASSNGNLRLHPGGTSVPLISSINYVAGQTRSNNGVVALSATGELAVFASQGSGTVDFVLDVTGYFE